MFPKRVAPILLEGFHQLGESKSQLVTSIDGSPYEVFKEGRGVMGYNDGTIYEGDWHNNERHGEGVCYFPSGSVYVGSFVRGHMEGCGSMLYADGDFFVGHFHRSVCHGPGVYYGGGREIQGTWENGVRVAIKQSVNVSELETFNLQKVHLETFGGVIRQLHGHFAYYSRFDNRFVVLDKPDHQHDDDGLGGIQRTTTAPYGSFTSDHLSQQQQQGPKQNPIDVYLGVPQMPSATTAVAVTPRHHHPHLSIMSPPSMGKGGEEPSRPHHRDAAVQTLPTITVPAAAVRSPPANDEAGASSDATLPSRSRTTRRGTAGPLSASVEPSDDERYHRSHPFLHISSAAPAAGGGGYHSRTNSNTMVDNGLAPFVEDDGRPPSFASSNAALPPSLNRERRRTSSKPGQQSRFPLASPMKLPLPGATPLRSTTMPSAAAWGAADGTAPPTSTAVVMSPTAVPPPQPQVVVPAQARYAKTSSPAIMFACATGCATESFSVREYMRHGLIFMFPFFSIPHLSFCPLVLDNLEDERECVVSGAALTREEEPPSVSVYVALAGLVCHILAIILASASHVGSARGVVHAGVSITELVTPVILWVVFAWVCAGYHGYSRIPHPVERLDRHLAPRLASSAANLIDTNAEVCVYTWDEEGRSKITNPHYKYRWLTISVIVGVVTAFASPVTRVAFGHPLFASDKSRLETVATGLAFASMCLFVTGITYYMLKVVDMQRQVLSQLRVFTLLAYIDDVSMCRPSEHRRVRFNLDQKFDASDFFDGFSGWLMTRSFSLGANGVSNHHSRSTAMSIVLLSVLGVALVAMGDALYAAATLQVASLDVDVNRSPYFSTAHAVGLVLMLQWGTIAGRYLFVCSQTHLEMSRHMTIMDVTSLCHATSRNDTDAAHIVKQCRSLCATSDPVPGFGPSRLQPGAIFVMVLAFVLGLVALCLQLVDAIVSASGVYEK